MKHVATDGMGYGTVAPVSHHQGAPLRPIHSHCLTTLALLCISHNAPVRGQANRVAFRTRLVKKRPADVGGSVVYVPGVPADANAALSLRQCVLFTVKIGGRVSVELTI